MHLNIEIKGQGFPILCLHGHVGSANCMSVFTDYLSQQFKTITPDLRGYGKSPSGGQFTMNTHLDDLDALLDHLQLEQCLILGWSLGGILAMEMALRHPQRLKGLILIATAAHPRGNYPSVSWLDQIYTGIAGLINLLKPGWQWNIETFCKRSLFRYLIQQHTPTAYQYLASHGTPAYLQTSRAAQKALSQALKAGYNRLEDLNSIQIPSLVLAGAEDRHITAKSSQETAQHLPNSQWQCYPDTAHLFPWEIPHQVLADINSWLKTNLSI